MQVSDRLTDIAELIVASAMDLGWGQITAQFGVPMCGEGVQRRAVNICAVGYGKLGGMELGYSSDLDLVFLHDSHGECQETGGDKPIDNQLFFVRLAQRIVHLLTMHSAAGRLYEVDVRLRPSGKGGMLVTNIDAFADYQREEAWTWEHQALLHARAVAGAAPLRERFEAVRLEVLCNHVRRDTLQSEVRSMRERMRKELSRGDAAQFRHQAGSRRHRRHRVPGAVLGAEVGAGLPARGDVLRHHPAAGVGGLRRSRAAGERGRADRCLPGLPHPHPPPLSRRGRCAWSRRRNSGTPAPR